MAKATLEFDLTDVDDREEFELMQRSRAAHLALWEISQEIFRPHRKHGYSDSRIQANLDAAPYKITEGEFAGCETTHAIEVVEALEKMFYQILENNDISLF